MHKCTSKSGKLDHKSQKPLASLESVASPLRVRTTECRKATEFRMAWAGPQVSLNERYANGKIMRYLVKVRECVDSAHQGDTVSLEAWATGGET